MASSSSSTPVQDRDTQLLFVGKQCSHASCLQVDFLPFKCQHCEHSFCQEHFKVEAHNCDKYDESKFNRVAPNCPLCNTPVAVRQGQDPNVRMDIHLEKECSIVTGKAASKSMPVCSRASCKKPLILPIACDKCRKQFCPTHRFPGDHSCSPQAQAAQSSSRTPPGSNLLSRLENIGSKASAAPKSNPFAAARRTVATTSAPAPKPPLKPVAASTSAAASAPSASGAGKPTSKPQLPFNKMDRRAKAERESKLKAMRARAAKGLLSEEEKAILAAEEVAARDKKDCVIM